MKTATSQTEGTQTEQHGEQVRRADARRLKMLNAVRPTPEEDAAITAAALTDPDNPPLAEGMSAQLKPARLRGRPALDATKVPTTMRLDSDVLDSFKATGDGWQTRINAALRDYLAARKLLARRYHATIHRRENGTEQMGEFLVVAADDDQAREKVRHYLLGRGMQDVARGYVYTVDIGNARMPALEVIY